MITAHVDVGLKEPPELVKATVPVGEPVTDAVQTVEAPPTKLDGLQVTAVVVGVVPTTTLKLPEAASPLASVTVTASAPAETEGTVKVTERAPLDVVAMVPDSGSEAPPKVAATVFEAAKPDPIIVTVAPDEPPAGLNAMAGTTVNVARAVSADASVATTVCEPAAEAGTVKVVLNEPEEEVPTVDGEMASDAPSYFTDAIVEEEANPVPVTVMTSPTCPEVSLRAMKAVLALTARLNEVVALLEFPSVTVRVTVNGDPAVSVGVQPREGESDVEHPWGRFVHV